MTNYGAVDFIPALATFLCENVPQCKITPSQFDCFNIFKQIIITLSPNFYLSNQTRTSRLRSTPTVKGKGWKPGMPGWFDTALITGSPGDPQQLALLEGARFYLFILLDNEFSFLGLRVGCICVIFKLPFQFTSYHHPLVYVEWFTPLRCPETLTGMHVISHSTRFHCQNAAIISADRIVHSCHLVGKVGLKINHDWTTDNVLDIAFHFYVNPYIDVDSFTALKC